MNYHFRYTSEHQPTNPLWFIFAQPFEVSVTVTTVPNLSSPIRLPNIDGVALTLNPVLAVTVRLCVCLGFSHIQRYQTTKRPLRNDPDGAIHCVDPPPSRLIA